MIIKHKFRGLSIRLMEFEPTIDFMILTILNVSHIYFIRLSG